MLRKTTKQLERSESLGNLDKKLKIGTYFFRQFLNLWYVIINCIYFCPPETKKASLKQQGKNWGQNQNQVSEKAIVGASVDLNMKQVYQIAFWEVPSSEASVIDF
jgi:hypothetical protein